MEAFNSTSSVTQTLSGEVADGQRKLIALAAARGNSSAVNPPITQLTNGALGGLHEKVCSILNMWNMWICNSKCSILSNECWLVGYFIHEKQFILVEQTLCMDLELLPLNCSWKGV